MAQTRVYKRDKDGKFAEDVHMKGIPSTADATIPYADADLDTPIAAAANPKTTPMELASYAGSDDPDIRDAAFRNPQRASLYKQTDRTCSQLLDKPGRLTKEDLDQLTPQAQTYLRIARKAKRSSGETYWMTSEMARQMEQSRNLNDDTFSLLAHSGRAVGLADRDDLDGQRVATIIDQIDDKAIIPTVASNRHLHPTAWGVIETRGKGDERTEQALAANPAYPAERANRLAEQWCKRMEKVNDPAKQTDNPRVGYLLAQRDDLTKENRAKVEQFNKLWPKYAKAYNRKNAKFKDELRKLGLSDAAGGYDAKIPPARV